MGKGSFPQKYLKNRRVFTAMILGVLALLTFLIVRGECIPKKYKIMVGEKSRYDISAPFDMVDQAATERFAREAANQVSKVYLKNPALTKEINERADAFARTISNERKLFDDANALDTENANAGYLRENSISRIVDKSMEQGVTLSREQALSILTGVTLEQLETFLEEVLSRVETYADFDITADNLNSRIIALQRSVQSSYANQNLKNMGISLASTVLKVNVDEDKERNEARQREVFAANLERKIIIPAGTRILSIDEFISTEKFNFLSGYGLVEDGKMDVSPNIKVLFIVAVLSVLLLEFLNRFCYKELYSNKMIVLLVSIVLSVFILCRILYPLHKLALPVYIAPLLAVYLIGLRSGFVAHLYVISVISLFNGMDLNTLLVFLIGGITIVLLVHNATQRSRFTLAGVVMSVLNTLMFVVSSEEPGQFSTYYFDALILLLCSFASSMISLGLIALLEGTFNTATPLRLNELTSGNTHLLKRLGFEAPGTHHHSLMVSYMAEAAAGEIGANPYLAKAGALYHDVGKLKNPDFFTENQNGMNPHDNLNPAESAVIITSHTTDGVELCERYKLPQSIIDIVQEHHGSTLVTYFYDKAIKKYGVEHVREADYRYSGSTPSSKESAIIMLADSCEAAVRSSGQKKEEEIADWVHRIIRSKYEDGQLDRSDISMKDIQRISKTFIRVLSGYYHVRIKYPEEAKLKGGAPKTIEISSLKDDGVSGEAEETAETVGRVVIRGKRRSTIGEGDSAVSGAQSKSPATVSGGKETEVAAEDVIADAIQAEAPAKNNVKATRLSD